MDITLYETALNDYRERLRRAEQLRCVDEIRRERQVSPVASAARPLRFLRALVMRPSRA